ncbi:MAG: DUF58 domain-containing protein [Candidatus Solibacter usitatus]|nr:DUF58 domain-containing protein [Candidatus Solibacter usitatus]
MPTPLLDRQLLERLERLTIRWHKSFRGLVGGHNRSRYAGPGQEFLDHRHFHQGDDLRAVNWRAYLRLEKLFLKMFQVEPRTPIRILLDASLSMTAAPLAGAPSKFDFGRRLAAALTYVGLVRHDSILLQPFHQRLDDTFLASGGRHRFGPVNDFLSAVEPGGKTSFFDVARLFISAYQKPGLLIIVSDFLDDSDALKPLQYLADFGNELVLVQLWSPSDREPALSGDVALTDSESGANLELSLDPNACRAYTQAFDRYAGAIENLALRSGGRYAGFSTSVPLEEAIFQALNQTGAELARGA